MKNLLFLSLISSTLCAYISDDLYRAIQLSDAKKVDQLVRECKLNEAEKQVVVEFAKSMVCRNLMHLSPHWVDASLPLSWIAGEIIITAGTLWFGFTYLEQKRYIMAIMMFLLTLGSWGMAGKKMEAQAIDSYEKLLTLYHSSARVVSILQANY